MRHLAQGVAHSKCSINGCWLDLSYTLLLACCLYNLTRPVVPFSCELPGSGPQVLVSLSLSCRIATVSEVSSEGYAPG